MLINCNKGFSMMETLISFSVLIFCIGLIVPSLVLVHKERANLEVKRHVIALLHDEIQSYLYDNRPLIEQDYEFKGTELVLMWEPINQSVVKGCIYWKGDKSHTNKNCLYAKKL